MNALEDFHFLYPLWFLLAPFVLFFWWWLSRQNTQSQAWQHFIDERLKPFVISGYEGSRSHWFRHVLLMTALIAIIALAGPSWQKRQLPAFQTQQGLVVVLDLSQSMLASDVSPNRMNRARFKLLDLLNIREEGQTGLVVFAGDAFAVSPLTDDVANIIEQAKNLSPQIMPMQGSNIDRGIDEAVLLLQQAGYATGDVLVIADGVGNLSKALQSAEVSASSGYRVSVASVGTSEGAPIPLSQNSFVRNNQGQLVIASLDNKSLQSIASKGQGLFQTLELTDDDVEGFQRFFMQDKSSLLNDKKTTVEHWRNEGIWLLWLLLLPALLLFRKGYLFTVGFCLLVVGGLLPQPASALSWDELWLNADQRAYRALMNKESEQAKNLFESPEWKASAAYKNGDFEESIDLFEDIKTAEGFYNKGNALAKTGKLEEAIKSYSQAMALKSDHVDAKFNQDLLKKMLEEQQKNQEAQQDQDNQQDQEGQKGDQQDQQSKDNQGQQGDKKPDSGEDGQAGQQSKTEQEKAEAAKRQAEEAAKDREEAAKREAEKKAAENAEKNQGKQKPEPSEMTEAEKEQAKQTKQWLHKIPDDSAGLWRRKFQYQYRQRQPKGATAVNPEGQQLW